MKVVAAYIVFAVMIAVLIGRTGRFIDYWKLNSGAVKTTGTVVQPTCEIHNSFRYKFSVGDRTFQATGIHSGRPCGSLKPGDSVAVFYLPTDPSTNMVAEPHGELENEIISITMAALLFPALGIGFWVWRSKRHAA